MRTRAYQCAHLLLSISALGMSLESAFGAPYDPAANDFSGRKGKTIYVSKLGDNSDGSSWAKALHTIRAALLSVPDEKGGHQVVIRPDTYAEANLSPSHRGAAGAYNLLVGDVDGSLGSGATGWVIVDSGGPLDVVRTNPKAPTGNPTWMILGSGDPSQETGLKSVDWWGPIKSNPEFSAVIWDRWILRGLYATASEGGIGFDMSCESGTEFTAIVENCIGIGRFAGAAVMGHVGRKEEPVVFRHSYFMCLDWWGDAGAAYVRAHNRSMPEHPDAVFENCTLVGPDNAFQAGNPGFDGYSRVRLKDCKLIVLNFSQPHGTPSTGIIASRIRGEYLHVDLEDCTLMGFKVFGVGDDAEPADVSYRVKGKVEAYVQYRQSVPPGMERLRYWPVDVFNLIRPPVANHTMPEEPTVTGQPIDRSSNTQTERDRRMQWWRDARFGMFVHWGLYAVPAGEYQGKRPNHLSSWIMASANIPRKEYEKFSPQFDPVQFDAARLVRAAKEAGMKYVVITAKHHDGFCLFDTKATPYNVVKATPYGKDILKPLSDECRKQGLKFCVYYSILDWHHPSQFVNTEADDLAAAYFKSQMRDGRKDEYVAYMKAQLHELVTKYDPAVLWFDGEWVDWWTEADGNDLVKYLRSLKPDIIVNNRVGKIRQGMAGLSQGRDAAGDFGTPEQQIPPNGLPGVDWETCMTMNDTWGFKRHDDHWKSAETLIRQLIDVASKGGNYLLNVGPTAEGLVPDASMERLQQIGAWMTTYGEAVYATSGSPFSTPLPWGRATTKPGKLFLHVFDWPADGRLAIPRLENSIQGAYLLGDPQNTPLPLTPSETEWTICLPLQATDPVATVVVLEVAGQPRAADLADPEDNHRANLADLPMPNRKPPDDTALSELIKLPVNFGPRAMENTPLLFDERPLLVLNYRDDTKYNTDEYKKSMYLFINDLRTGEEVTRFGEGHSFANAIVRGNEMNVFASEGSDHDWFQSIYRFSSNDLKNWKRELAIQRDGEEHLFNSSVCQDDEGYLMAYESNLPVQFCFKFARSANLATWEKIDNLVFSGVNREYSACPVIRYVAPYYYVIYLHAAVPGHKGWISYLARSQDLVRWELSPRNPILEAASGEGINNSDVDLFEYEGNTYLFYATGDQSTWGTVRTAIYRGPMKQFFQSYFPPHVPTIQCTTDGTVPR